MRESIKLDVVKFNKGVKEVELEFEYDTDVITLRLNGEELCYTYLNAFLDFCKRVIEIWDFSKKPVEVEI